MTTYMGVDPTATADAHICCIVDSTGEPLSCGKANEHFIVAQARLAAAVCIETPIGYGLRAYAAGSCARICFEMGWLYHRLVTECPDTTVIVLPAELIRSINGNGSTRQSKAHAAEAADAAVERTIEARLVRAGLDHRQRTQLLGRGGLLSNPDKRDAYNAAWAAEQIQTSALVRLGVESKASQDKPVARLRYIATKETVTNGIKKS